MLTKKDLAAIRDVVDERLESRLEEKLDKKLAPMKKDIRRIRKDVDYIIGTFDEKLVNHERRLIKVEDRLGITQEKN